LENHVALKFFATVFLMKFKEDSNIIDRVTYKKAWHLLTSAAKDRLFDHCLTLKDAWNALQMV